MKKLLILGQVPKEYGGSYTTGVANVIVELSGLFKNDFDTYLYATNLKTGDIINKGGIKILGYSYKKLTKLLIKEVLKSPIGLFRQYKEYKKTFGIIAIKNVFYYVILKDYINNIKPDIINAHGIMFAPVLSNLDKNDSTFYSFHGFMYDDSNSISANKKRGLDIEKLYFNGAKFVKNAIYLTEEMRDKGENDLGIEAKNSTIISNGVNVDKFRFCETSRQQIRKELDINSNEKVFISVGALTNRKNHIGFIDFLVRNDFKGHYWIIGKFEAEETKNKILEYQKNISSFKIQIINYIEHQVLFKYYSAADFYAHPSTSEGQALVVFEALCCGLPIIVNQDIRGTVSIGDNYEIEVKYINLRESVIPNQIMIDRNVLSKKCKSDFNWMKTSEKYKNFFLDAVS